MSNKIPNKIYYLLFLIPVLAQYSIFNILDLDVIAMLYIVFVISHNNNVYQYNTGKALAQLYLIYTAFNVVINLLSGYRYATELDIILRSGRFCLYFFLAVFVFPRKIDYRDAMIVYRNVAYAASIYIFIQALFFYSAGIMLPNKIGLDLGTAIESYGRLKSFYSEPADMAYSVIPFICCSLFGPRYENKDHRLKDSIVVSIAIAISTSSQGLSVVLVMWIIWGIININNPKSSGIKLIFIILIPIVAYYLMNNELILYTLGRLEGGTASTAWQARSGGYTIFRSQSFLNKLLGNGYGNYMSENTQGLNLFGNFIYFSTISGSLFMNGYLGTILLFATLLAFIRNGAFAQKILIVAFIALSIGGDPLSGKYLVIYFTLALCNIKKHVNNYN